MSPTMLRQLWSLVETTQASLIVSLDDADLVQWLLKRLQTESTINYSDQDVVNDYLNSRLALIRDLAESRLAGGH
ncbi:hypothetical protein [Lyngbya sp. PCC 8106]|uniref:hypothetical protein n=1 Tax=Lyngbya sp. (strain PCC 8106) TaxID=313612 RepID=UPI0000EAB259|nr:hypothetical protein [Lyngbya sp. PCC 8106]EAW35757.1 hypothetical protein L8106_28156 [Lyngbya sp. PCC 8106]